MRSFKCFTTTQGVSVAIDPAAVVAVVQVPGASFVTIVVGEGIAYHVLGEQTDVCTRLQEAS